MSYALLTSCYMPRTMRQQRALVRRSERTRRTSQQVSRQLGVQYPRLSGLPSLARLATHTRGATLVSTVVARVTRILTLVVLAERQARVECRTVRRRALHIFAHEYLQRLFRYLVQVASHMLDHGIIAFHLFVSIENMQVKI